MIRISLALGILALSAGPVSSHEFMLLPEKAAAAAGGAVAVSLTMTEAYMVPDRAPPADKVTLTLIGEGGPVPVAVRPGDRKLDASVTPKGPSVLAASLIRDRMQKPRNAPEGAEAVMTRSAAFSKSFVGLDAASDVWRQPVGSRLEIVPLADPAAVRPGGELPVKILFDGQPVQAAVQATYDAGGAPGHGFVVKTTSGADGLASIPVDRGGLWLVRARHGLDESRDGYVRYNGAANLVFTVD